MLNCIWFIFVHQGLNMLMFVHLVEVDAYLQMDFNEWCGNIEF